VLPVIIIALLVIPLLVFAFLGVKRRNAAGEKLEPGTSEAELEREFAAAEAYEDEWRAKQHPHSDHHS
jgi:uncharacterized membrane protein